ncbi:MAG: hypothetical protein CMK95_08330 [Pseudomonas sp.]|nr:hypothetical protein [Pseudomonas sp.]
MIHQFNGLLILQKDLLHKVMMLHFSLRGMSLKEVSPKLKFLSGLVTVIKDFSLDLTAISDLMKSLNLTLQISLKNLVVKSTLSLTIEIKSLICGEREEPPLYKLQKEIFKFMNPWLTYHA